MAANAAATLENIYGQAKAQREAAAQRSRDAQLQSLETMYGGGIRRVNDAADEAQRQNYIAQQIQKRNLGQEMAAAGLSGGAAESTVLALANQYGANRRATESDRLQQLSALETEWAAQRAAAESAYNERMADIGADWASQLAAAKAAQLQQQAATLAAKYTNDYKGLGISDDKAAGFAADLKSAQIGEMDRSWVVRNAKALADEYGDAGYRYLLGNAYDPTPANQRVQSVVDNAVALEAERLRQQALMQKIYG